MGSVIRKHSESIIPSVIYLVLIAFAIVVSLGVF